MASIALSIGSWFGLEVGMLVGSVGGRVVGHLRGRGLSGRFWSIIG